MRRRLWVVLLSALMLAGGMLAVSECSGPYRAGVVWEKVPFWFDGQPVVIAFSPDGHLLACAYRDGKVSVWDWRASRLLARFNFCTEA
jgi:WD40 repeat protein